MMAGGGGPEVRATPAQTVRVRAVPVCATGEEVEYLGLTRMAVWGGRWRTTRTTRAGGGTMGPHAHGNAVRHVGNDLNVEGSVQQKP